MSFPQLGYQYIRPIYPSERQGIGSARAGTELSPSGALSNVLSTMYGSPFAAAQGYGAFLPYSNDISIFNQLGTQYELKDSPGVQHPGFAHHHPAFYPYGQYQFGDPSRPKNATRESTSTLKAWLSEHRKNPYPTKGEKIMLAIITKMTLTQVSTWFANARRRLKKENKMTWAPRSRTDEEGNVYNSDHEGEEGEKREDDEEIDLENIDTEHIENKDDLDDQDELHADLKLDGRSDSEISDGYEDLPGPDHRFLKAVVKDTKDIHGDRELDKQSLLGPPARFNKLKPLPRTGQPGFGEWPYDFGQPSAGAISLDVGTKLWAHFSADEVELSGPSEMIRKCRTTPVFFGSERLSLPVQLRGGAHNAAALCLLSPVHYSSL
ncbi:hypothetical protein GJAV_G00230160 [Gymnothorax javanicus]|nr:hypothetical protein GJAV_G00230160 [Gymnothorax javanicus]